ncbi:transcriptional regulator NanR [Gemmobacter caeruleus]|uniref:transcriptional regulator NanR n=1 Tax=Gemmobacter caeruleus TaxID=2595004 RepID=UPI0011EDF285|nr:transcriptional regulator NanR [Gemmobacter caeruleus]
MTRRANPIAPSDPAGAPVAEKIVRRKLSDQVFDRLRDLIARGELQAGDPMPSERDLMERFGVGRPAVREALQSMHTMGLITIAHGERSRVNELNAGSVLNRVDEVARLLLSAEPGQLDHLKEARGMFECGVVRRAAETADDGAVADLRGLVAQQRDRLGDPAAFVAADVAFHARIAAMTGNPIIAAVSQAMLGWLFQYHGGLLHWSGNEDTTLREHDEIVNLIAARDGEGAAQAMRRHLDRSNDYYRHPG